MVRILTCVAIENNDHVTSVLRLSGSLLDMYCDHLQVWMTQEAVSDRILLRSGKAKGQVHV